MLVQFYTRRGKMTSSSFPVTKSFNRRGPDRSAGMCGAMSINNDNTLAQNKNEIMFSRLSHHAHRTSVDNNPHVVSGAGLNENKMASPKKVCRRIQLNSHTPMPAR